MSVKYLTRAQAAEYIKAHFCIPCSVGTLTQHATDGTGPLYRRIGRTTLYDPADLHRWFEERATKPIRRAVEAPWGKKRGPRRANQPSAPKDAPPISTRQVADQQPEA
jgi:hypothetical protein